MHRFSYGKIGQKAIGTNRYAVVDFEQVQLELYGLCAQSENRPNSAPNPPVMMTRRGRKWIQFQQLQRKPSFIQNSSEHIDEFWKIEVIAAALKRFDEPMCNACIINHRNNRQHRPPPPPSSSFLCHFQLSIHLTLTFALYRAENFSPILAATSV